VYVNHAVVSTIARPSALSAWNVGPVPVVTARRKKTAYPQKINITR